MPILALLEIAIQVYFVVHAVRTGRDRYWIFIIILFPGIGCVAYFFAEYLPDLQRDARMSNVRSGIERTLNPTRRIRMLADQVELTPSVGNKQLLAQEYVNTGMFNEAIAVYKSCMQGLYENDLTLIGGLARAQYLGGDLKGAKENLERLRELRGNRKCDEFDLLYGKTLEKSGDISGALKEYAEVVKFFLGEDARCTYALLLKQVGKTREANELFDEILRNARLSERFYRQTQKEWIRIAKRERT